MNARKLTTHAAMIAVLVLGFSAPPAVGQDDRQAPPAASEPGGADELGKLLKLAPGELDELMQRAKVDQLRYEREQAAAEIRTHIAYKDDHKGRQKAIDLLTKGKSETAAGNIELIAKAFAAVDRELRAAQELIFNGKFADATAALNKRIDPGDHTYRSALTHYLRAEALTRAGSAFRAVEAYRDLMAEMPGRLSFAAVAGQKAAEAFEKLGRLYYAMQMYAYCLDNYGLTLEKDTIHRMSKRYEEIRDIYRNPMASVAGRMGDVAKRLSRSDSGEKTQQKQQEIVALLEDLIKTAEEKARRHPPMSREPDPPQGTQQPSLPAQVSVPVPGPVRRPTDPSKIREGTGTDGWARLSPREKEQLEALQKRVMSERNREQNAEYATSLTRPEE